MNIVYAVAGEGMGHATRSRPIIEHLSKRHNVHVFAGGKALRYLQRFVPASWIASMYLVYRANAVSSWRTVLLNLARSPLYALSFLKMLLFMLVLRVDVLITDYEPWSAWAALLTGVPVISIDNENVLTKAELSIPKECAWFVAKARLVTALIIPYARATIIPSFFFPPLKNARAQYVAPIIRKEIASRTPTQGERVLVYQTSATNQQLIDTLQRFPRQQFVIYGFPREELQGNLAFKRFNEQEFFDDLASAKAVIANGGFSLLTEAIALRKPVLSIPVAGQGEQIVNAHYLEKLGYGMMAHQASPAVLKRFFARLPKQREALKKLRGWNLPSVIKTTEKALHDVQA